MKPAAEKSVGRLDSASVGFKMLAADLTEQIGLLMRHDHTAEQTSPSDG